MINQSATDEFNVLTTTRFGRMLVNRHDVYIGRSLIVYGEYSWGEIEIFTQLIQPGHVVIEAGANIGAHTVPLSRLAGEGGRVLAFEPTRLTFQLLNANIALNQCSNVVAVNAIVGDTSGHALAPDIDPEQSNNFGGLSMIGLEHGERVPVQTIDGLDLARCNFIKADVEGMEMDVLKGAVDTLSKHRPLLYVENHNRESSVELIEYIQRQGYKLWWHTPSLFNPENYRGIAVDVFEGVVSSNMICIPEELKMNVTDLRPVKGSDEWLFD